VVSVDDRPADRQTHAHAIRLGAEESVEQPEGAFEAMGTGEVDLNWAREHHDLWLEDELAKGRISDHPTRLSVIPAE
jgi:hypothetical protein